MMYCLAYMLLIVTIVTLIENWTRCITHFYFVFLLSQIVFFVYDCVYETQVKKDDKIRTGPIRQFSGGKMEPKIDSINLSFMVIVRHENSQ